LGKKGSLVLKSSISQVIYMLDYRAYFLAVV